MKDRYEPSRGGRHVVTPTPPSVGAPAKKRGAYPEFTRPPARPRSERSWRDNHAAGGPATLDRDGPSPNVPTTPARPRGRERGAEGQAERQPRRHRGLGCLWTGIKVGIGVIVALGVSRWPRGSRRCGYCRPARSILATAPCRPGTVRTA